MRRFSANLGFLWADLPLPHAIRAAHAAGFDAVECHWPYATPPGTLRAALIETGLAMLSLNTRPGDTGRGDFGLSALKGRETEARDAVDEALRYATETGTRAVHVMAGRNGDLDTFLATLAHACDAALPLGLTILIEPLNRFDAPGYLLETTDQAAAILDRLARPNLRILFDCYHIARTEGDVRAAFDRHRNRIGHVQFAAVPDRGPPDHGAIDYPTLLARLDWPLPFGAEYRPLGPTDTTLGWMAACR